MTSLSLSALFKALTLCVLCAHSYVGHNAQAHTSNNNREDGPRFLSRGQTYRAVIGDTLLLPCQVQNLGSLVLLWRRGAAVLTAASLMVIRDDRFRLVDGYNLQITQVGPQDAGDYVCQISDRENKDQVHTVEILVPASVRPSPEGGRVVARKGGGATLECRAAGNPVPSVVWTRLNDSVRVGEGPQLVLEQVERTAAGKYRCTVDNGVGTALHRDFTLQVLYPPEITVERSWLHSGEGFKAEIVCTVLADPPAEVSWYQNSFPISQTDRLVMMSHQQNHTLLVSNVQPEDFGNYSCAADNSLGRSRQHVEISGRPGPAHFLSPPHSSRPRSYTLVFQLDSYPPLDELRLLYRQLMVNESFQQPGRWYDEKLNPTNGDSAETQLTHRVSHELRGLKPSAVYEVIVQAKNRYGWNEVSDIFQFHTRGIGEGTGGHLGIMGSGGGGTPGAEGNNFSHSGAAISLPVWMGQLLTLAILNIFHRCKFLSNGLTWIRGDSNHSI